MRILLLCLVLSTHGVLAQYQVPASTPASGSSCLENLSPNLGFLQDGPENGIKLQVLSNTVLSSDECNQRCCDFQGCRAAWFYVNGVLAECQLWYCENCAAKLVQYTSEVHSQVGIKNMPQPNVPASTEAPSGDNSTPADSNNAYNTAQTVYDSPGQTSNDNPGQTSFDNPVQTSYDNPGQTSYDNPGQTSYDNPGQTSYDNPVQTSNDNSVQTSYDNSVQTSNDNSVQTSYDNPVQTGTGPVADTSGTNPDPSSSQQQGQWIFNPITGQYTYQVIESVQPDQNQNPYPDPSASNVLPSASYATGDMSSVAVNTSAPVYNASSVSGLDLMTDMSSSPELNATAPVTTTAASSGWLDWWFGGDKAAEDEAEKEWEEEEEEWEKEFGATTRLPSSTGQMATTQMAAVGAPSTQQPVASSTDDVDKWLTDFQGNSPDQPISGGDVKQGSVDLDKPQTFAQPEVPAWESNYLNAPVIAVGACAAFVLILLLLVFVGRKLAGKNDRAQYKPLRESFSGSSTYHEDI